MPKFLRPYVYSDDPNYFGYMSSLHNSYAEVPFVEDGAFQEAYKALLNTLPPTANSASLFDLIKQKVAQDDSLYSWGKNKKITWVCT